MSNKNKLKPALLVYTGLGKTTLAENNNKFKDINIKLFKDLNFKNILGHIIIQTIEAKKQQT